MKQEELKIILENHKHWIYEDCDGWKEMRADLRHANLCYANLSNADLSNSDLRYAELRKADLSGVNLCGASLRKADLSGVNLRDAHLRDSDLRRANLSNADLSNSDLRYADLRDVDLCNVDLSDSDLRYADLCGANLCGANLRHADLSNANLCGAENIPFIPYACPDFGKFIGYKKASGCIVELEIPEDAKRLSSTTRKCRCDKAKVLRILNCNKEILDIIKVRSDFDRNFVYKVGEIVSVDNFNEDRFNECSTGIHFFINFQEAVDY